MNVIECAQGSAEWHAARCGRVTASRVADVIAKTKSGWGASRANYMGELIAERLTGEPAEKYTNAAMAWGTEKEPEARAAYEMATETWVSEVGFVLHPRIECSGASPDGLVGADGLIEIKAPNTSTHIETLLGQNVPSRYVTQIQWQLACTGRAWCDFVSFDPRLPEAMRLFTSRVTRDERLIASLEAEVAAFLIELNDKVLALTDLYGERAAA
ncbi:MAG: lambda exonuclease family protein [Methylocella sp.]